MNNKFSSPEKYLFLGKIVFVSCKLQKSRFGMKFDSTSYLKFSPH